jgi:hypothetical protein
MSPEKENFDFDIEWLLKLKPNATEYQQEAFIFKVAELMVDLGLPESAARQKAYKMVFLP